MAKKPPPSPPPDYSLEPGEDAITARRKNLAQLNISDVVSTPAGGFVVPGMSTDASGNIVTQATLGATQAAAGQGGTAKLPDLDWAASFFSSLGLPPDVVNQVNQIFTQYSDVNAASQAALGYIRGTPWYAQTFPGIAAGIQKGLFTDESGYRNLLNQQSQIYKQYLGRDISGDEFATNLANGTSNQTLGGQLQGAALAGTYGGDWRYTLGAFGGGQPTGAETQALGEEQAGLDTPLGQQVQRRLTLAQQRLSTVFTGSLATASRSNANGRISSPGLAPSSTPDLAA